MIEPVRYYNESMANVDIDLGKYSLGWSDPEKNVFKPEKGLNEGIIRKMSEIKDCLLYTSPSPRDPKTSRMPSSA